METSQAIVVLTQSEKLKAGIIWASKLLELSPATGASPGNAPMASHLVRMVGAEAFLARKLSGDDSWMNVEKHIDMAIVMIDSGVPQEGIFHLTRALSQVTSRGEKAMAFLKDAGLL